LPSQKWRVPGWYSGPRSPRLTRSSPQRI